MKRCFPLLLALLLCLPACGKKEQPRTEVVVFAAASLEAALTEIAELYKTAAPDVDLVFTFDSSGTLRTQIQEGAACDLFLSAGQSQMDDVEADYVAEGSRIDLLENKVVLAVPESDPAGIGSFAGLTSDRLTLLCIGNSDVPVGAYSLEILDHLGLDIEALEREGKVTYASNVTEVATQVKEGAVDCGIIYATDAATHGLTVVDETDETMCRRVVYPAAVIGSGSAPEAAQAFLDYLAADGAAAGILENIGFTVLTRS